MKFLDQNGLATLWAKINALLEQGAQQLFQLIDAVDAKINSRAPIYSYTDVQGTAAKTSSPYYAARFDVTDPNVTQYQNGMVVHLRVPVAGHSTYGTALQINNLGYRPIVYDVNSPVGTRYEPGSTIVLTYNATQTATLYLGSGAQTVTGCWQVMDQNNTEIYKLRKNNGNRTMASGTARANLVFTKSDGTLVGINDVKTTAVTKTLYQGTFNPFMPIYYCSGAKATGSNPSAFNFYTNYGSIDLRYAFNCGTAVATNKDVWLRCVRVGSCEVQLAADPFAQELPNRADGYLYIYLGFAASYSGFELYQEHPIFYHNGTELVHYVGQKITQTNSGDIVGSWE